VVLEQVTRALAPMLFKTTPAKVGWPKIAHGELPLEAEVQTAVDEKQGHW